MPILWWTAELSVLPDSGADISAAGPELLDALGTNVQNLLPTDVSPKVADGRPMKALGAIPVRIRLHERTVATTIYIFEQVTGVLLSWTPRFSAAGMVRMKNHEKSGWVHWI